MPMTATTAWLLVVTLFNATAFFAILLVDERQRRRSEPEVGVVFVEGDE